MKATEIKVISALFPKSIQIPELGPGPRSGALPIAALNEVLTALRIGNESRYEIIRALTLLWHDHHDQSHKIVQDLSTADAAYVHALIHRREPDYSNANYWFRRVGNHPAFLHLPSKAETVARETGDDRITADLRLHLGWDAHAFVDLCENPRTVSDPRRETLRRIQQAEFELLLLHLVRSLE